MPETEFCNCHADRERERQQALRSVALREEIERCHARARRLSFWAGLGTGLAIGVGVITLLVLWMVAHVPEVHA